MPIFSYRARDQKGILVTGRLEGAAMEPIKNLLSEQGLIPLRVKSIQSKVGVEIGTLGGYSASWLLQGLAHEGKLYTLELEAKRADFEHAGTDA